MLTKTFIIQAGSPLAIKAKKLHALLQGKPTKAKDLIEWEANYNVSNNDFWKEISDDVRHSFDEILVGPWYLTIVGKDMAICQEVEYK